MFPFSLIFLGSYILPVSRTYGGTPNQNSIQFILIRTQASFKHINHKTKVKLQAYYKGTKTLASLTWKMLAKNFDTQTVEHNSSRNSFESWKIVEQIQNGLPRWILVRLTTTKLERKKVRRRINLREQKIIEGGGPNLNRAYVGNKERSKVLFLANESRVEGLAYFRGLNTLWANL